MLYHFFANGNIWADEATIVFELESEEENFHPIKAMRMAINAYLQTPEGKNAVERNGGHYFSWEHAASLPDHICKSFGFKIINARIFYSVVDLNENFA